MHRTQLNLDDWQYEALRSRAAREGKSLSGLVREVLSEYLTGTGPARLDGIAGAGSDPEVPGRDHDRALYGEVGNEKSND